MERNSWEVPVVIGCLIICLAVGLWRCNYTTPQPVIGVLPFVDLIYQDPSNRLPQVLEAARNEPAVAAVV